MDMPVSKEKITSGAHLSVWMDDTLPSPELSSLERNIKVDVAVIGGGIAGLTTAYCLLKANKKVAVLEDGNIGSGETGRTTAHLTNALDDRYFELKRLFGEDALVHIAQSHSRAIDLIEKIVADEKIECDFERLNGYLFLHHTDKRESLDKELDALSKAELDARIMENVPGMNTETGPCIMFPRQAQFHPMKYLKGLARAIKDIGGNIFTSTHVESISDTGVKVRSGFTVEAKDIVVATNTPFNNKFVIHTKQYPYRTYVVGAKIKKGLVEKALWWDTGDQESKSSFPPYHYVRLQDHDAAHDILICGGEDHPTGLPENEHLSEEERYKLLESWARQRFDIEEVVYRWSGQVMEPMDSLAYIGKNPMDRDNVYIITGDSGNGMTHATLGAILLTDLITGKENPWQKIYDPSRMKIFGAGNVFFKEFVLGFIDYLKTTPDMNPDQVDTLKENKGIVVDWKGKDCGIYKDEHDMLHIVHAECTHLGCTVKWNDDEKSWDCPCHGSRYTYKGKVMNGPANEDLAYHSEHWGEGAPAEITASPQPSRL